MTRSIFSRGLTIAAAACMAAAHAVHVGYLYVCSYIEDWRAFMTGPMEPRAGSWDNSVLASKRARAQARAVRAGSDRRQRPTMTTRWRMCSSG